MPTPGDIGTWNTERMRRVANVAAGISRSFAAGAVTHDDIVTDSLRVVGGELGVDIAFLALFADDVITDVWEWTSWGGAGRPPAVGDSVDEVYRSIIEPLHRGAVIRISDIAALGMEPQENDMFAAIDARSTLLVPVREEDELVGVASVLTVGRTSEWTDEDVAALQFFGDLLLGAVRRHRRRADRRRERVRTDRIAAHVPDALVFSDAVGLVTWAAPSVERVLGFAPGALAGRPLVDLAGADDGFALARSFAAVWGGAGGATVTVLLRRASGEVRWFEVTTSRTDDAGDDGPELLHTIRDVHSRQLEVAALADMALTDSLTGVLNRRGLRQAIDGLSADDLPAAVVFVDLDRFKAINDRFGHAVGDEVLAAVGHRLRNVGTGDVLCARLGGDEFVVVRPRVPDDELATAVRAAVGTAVATTVGAIPLEASLGTSVIDRLDDAPRALAEADAAMYRAKRAVG